MAATLFLKLFAIFAVVGIGWAAGRTQWLSRGDPGRVLSNVTFYLFVPALLFRTTARIDFTTMPWRTLAAYFIPVVTWMLLSYAWQRRRAARPSGINPAAMPPAAPAVLAICFVFGNTVQLGIPMVTALFGEAGLSILAAIVSVHALTLLSLLTVLVERDLARAAAAQAGRRPGLGGLLWSTARNTVVHPVTLPVLGGLAWNALGLPLPAPVDETLQMLGQAVIPLCLVVIGMSMAHFGIRGALRDALWASAGKLLVLPALALACGHWVFGLSGVPLAVIVLTAALPVGSNALLFAQRYGTREAEASTAVVVSTLLFAVTAPLWLMTLRMLM